MGQLTRAQIVEHGLAKAGAPENLTSEAEVWLNAWLRSQYRAWPWPFLQRRVTGVALGTGVQSLTLGAGAGGVTLEIARILDPLFIYSSGYTKQGRVRVRNITGGYPADDEIINNPVTNIGQPAQCKVRADTTLWGKWVLWFTPVPNADYLLAIDYIVQPADIAADATVPIYPNDRTMIQAVLADAYQHQDDERYNDALQVLASMVVDDRVKYGEVAGTNDVIGLDPSTFR